MSDLNDDNTRQIVGKWAGAIEGLLAHFLTPDATWDSFELPLGFQVQLALVLEALAHCARTHVEEQTHVTTDLGT